MSWSINLGRLFGIPVYVHTTFALLLAWVGVVHWTIGGTVRAVAGGLLFVIAIFGCVLLHELGHALAARKYGVPTRDITLLPIGGLARLERMPERPLQELRVALAGPAVNVVIAGLLFAGLVVTGSFAPFSSLGVASGSFLERLMLVNGMLVLFNMIPAFPMDGGRVLRALLAMRIDYVKATRIAATIGKGAAIVFGFAGLFTNPFLVLIAVFVWIGASQEATAVEPVSLTVESGEMLQQAVERMQASGSTTVPVVRRQRTVGVLSLGSVAEFMSFRRALKEETTEDRPPAKVLHPVFGFGPKTTDA